MNSLTPARGLPTLGGGAIGLPGRGWQAWLAGAIYVGCAAAFVADLAYDIPWAFGVLYIPLVCTAVFYRAVRGVWWLAAAATAMVVLGCIFPVADFNTHSLVNRGLSLVAILVTAALVRLARDMQDRLALQTLRAQSADHMKTQIFANLSHELRTPLNAVIGFADLLAANCRPDQHSALEHIRSAGQRLLATVENLLDLAHAADRVLRAETLDLAAILRQAVEAARTAAAEQSITLLPEFDANWLAAVGDAWAVRRIVDNLLGNAVKFTPPGGQVRIGTEIADGRVVVVVQDTGRGMSAEVLRQLGEPFFQAESGFNRPFQGLGTGLALSRRLADAMGATLTFVSEPGQGTIVRLGLRAE